MLHQPPQSGALGHPILTGHLPTQVLPLPASFSVDRSLGEPRLPAGDPVHPLKARPLGDQRQTQVHGLPLTCPRDPPVNRLFHLAPETLEKLFFFIPWVPCFRFYKMGSPFHQALLPARLSVEQRQWTGEVALTNL